MHKITSFIICIFCMMSICAAAPKTHSVSSPDGTLTVKVSGDSFSVLKNGTAVIARRKGNEWYVGAITDWTPRDLYIDLGRLFDGQRNATIYADGVNAHRSASDLRISKTSLSGKIKVHLALGGGWTCRITESPE